jgi:hypothetical protein
MIDPFYRTVDGFLCLLQKEFSAFGHKFEDRLGRRGHSKEVSPVCLQYLDCVWQMQRQFATAFEFSQCMYSGLFVNFRRNSERERVQMMRNVGPYEDMQSDDFDFSTLAAYVNLLLRTSGVAALLLNANYIPPKAAQKQVRILSVTYRRAQFSFVCPTLMLLIYPRCLRVRDSELRLAVYLRLGAERTGALPAAQLWSARPGIVEGRPVRAEQQRARHLHDERAHGHCGGGGGDTVRLLREVGASLTPLRSVSSLYCIYSYHDEIICHG